VFGGCGQGRAGRGRRGGGNGEPEFLSRGTPMESQPCRSRTFWRFLCFRYRDSRNRHGEVRRSRRPTGTTMPSDHQAQCRCPTRAGWIGPVGPTLRLRVTTAWDPVRANSVARYPDAAVSFLRDPLPASPRSFVLAPTPTTPPRPAKHVPPRAIVRREFSKLPGAFLASLARLEKSTIDFGRSDAGVRLVPSN
jgi:hypothetical protein